MGTASPRNTTSLYVLNIPKTSFTLGAAFFSHIASYTEHGYDLAAASHGELLRIIENALELTKTRNTLLILGVASPTGWEPSAVQAILGSARLKGFSHRQLSICLVDLYQNELKFNPPDSRMAPYIDFFIGEMEEETLARVVEDLRKALLLRESLSLAEAAKIAVAKEHIVTRAFSRLQKEGGYSIEWIKGIGNVFSKRS